MKLKTLKDIEFEKLGCDCRTKLKEEAIKWVKYHKIIPFGTFCEFFNITKEDLK